MKWLLVVFLMVVLWLGWSNRVVDSMSVRENNVYAKDYISWDQWCWYTQANGKVVKVKVAEFRLQGQVSQVGELQTNLCQNLSR